MNSTDELLIWVIVGIISFCVMVFWAIPQQIKVNAEAEERRKARNLELAKSWHQAPPKCLTCGSTSVDRITTGNKVKNVLLWGVWSVGHVSKTFKCRSCGYKW